MTNQYYFLNLRARHALNLKLVFVVIYYILIFSIVIWKLSCTNIKACYTNSNLDLTRPIVKCGQEYKNSPIQLILGSTYFVSYEQIIIHNTTSK